MIPCQSRTIRILLLERRDVVPMKRVEFEDISSYG